MDFNVILVGVGNIGLRHLEGLSRLEHPIKLTLVDPSAENIDRARKEIKKPELKRKIQFFESVADVSGNFDLAIISTQADIRRPVVESLVHRCAVKNIILEKVVAQKADDVLALEQLLERKRIAAWVNLTRRQWPIYRKIKKERNIKDNFHINVYGSTWGLAKNAIHYLDLFVWLNDLNSFSIERGPYPSNTTRIKDNQFDELFGTIICRGRDCHAALTSTCIPEKETLVVLSQEDRSVTINERRGWAVTHEYTLEENSILSHFSMPKVSDMTTIFVADILRTGKCNLPRYSQTIKVHLELLTFLQQTLSLDKSVSDDVFNVS
jgi:hypothetical protein